MSWEKVNSIHFQRLLAAACIVLLSLVYMFIAVSFTELPRMLTGKVYSGKPRVIRPAYAPNIPPPPVRDGKAPVLYRIDTNLPVVFLTIDDGVDRPAEAIKTLRDLKVPATLFLVERYAQRAPGYFAQLADATGSMIENHTLDHREMPKLSYDEQKKQICGTSQAFERMYGRRSTLLRPPYGEFDDNTLHAAADCGISAVVHWHALVENGVMQYQRGDKLLPGDIVLMHFKPTFRQDVEAFVRASKSAGLEPQLLEDWLWP